MPRPSAEPKRRADIVAATIQEIGAAGSLEVTVQKIARRAGVSSALAHHYFGSKEAIFLAAMRHVLTQYGEEVRAEIARQPDPRSKVEAIVCASFSATNFRREVVAAWLNFYVLAQTMPEAARLLRIYRRRLSSNLSFWLRPMLGDHAPVVAESLGALVDGVYLREALAKGAPDREAAIRLVLELLEAELQRKGPE